MKVYRFATFTLHLGRYELAEGARPIALPRVAMEILILLVEHRGNLVSRQEIARRIWPASDPDDVVQSINTAVNRIRNALRDDLNKPVFIQTVIGKGYRFVAEIVETGGAGDDRRVTEEGLSSSVNKLALEQFQQWQNAAPSVEVSVVEANGRAIVLALLPALLTGIVALALFLSLRHSREYLWLALFAFITSAESVFSYYSYALPWTVLSTSLAALLFAASSIALIEFVRRLLRFSYSWVFLFWQLFVVLSAIFVPFAIAAGSVRSLFAALILFANFLPFLALYVGVAAFLVRAFWQGNHDAQLFLPGFLCVAALFSYDATAYTLDIYSKIIYVLERFTWSFPLRAGHSL